MSDRCRLVRVAALLAVSSGWGWTVQAQPQDPAPPQNPPAVAPAEAQVTQQVTRAALDDLKKRIESATDLSPADQMAALEQVKQAQESLKQAEDFDAGFKRFPEETKAIESRRQQKQRELEILQREKVQRASPVTPLPQLEQALAGKQQELVQAQTALSQAEAKMAARAERQKQIKDRLARLPAEAEQLAQELNKLSASTDPPLVVEARRLKLLADRKRQESEPAALQAEATYLSALEAANLIQLDRQYQSTKVALLTDEVADWQKEVLRKKSSEAKDRADVARSYYESATIKQLKEIYQENADVVETEIDLRDKQKQIQEEVTTTAAREALLSKEFEELKSREKAMGASASFGIRLREERKQLPETPRHLRLLIRERLPTYEQAQLGLLEVREKLARLDNLNKVIERTVAEVSSERRESDEERRALQSEVQEAYEQKKKYLVELESAYDAYISSLEKLEAEQLAFAAQIELFQQYIDERILWIPTHKTLTLARIVDDAGSLRRLADSGAWASMWNFLKVDALYNWPAYAAALITWLALLLTQGRQRRAIRHDSQKASSRLNTSIQPTWGALFWTTVKSVVFPFPFLFLGWRGVAARGGSVPELSYVFTIALWLWWLEFLRHVCRPYGLGDSHFQWPTRVNQVVTVQLSSFLVLASPLALLIAILHARPADGGTDAMERIFGIAFFLLLANTLHWLTSRKSGIFQEWINAHPGSWLDRLAALWHALAVALPLLFAGLTIAGYTYTVERLSVRLAQTLMMVVGAIMARALLFRWLTLRQRRLAIERARQVRAALAEAQGEKEGTSLAVLEAQESRTNLADVSTQSKRLVNTTIVTLSLILLWLIWVDVLPALQKLDVVMLPGTSITLMMLLKALLEVIFVTTAARNIPGLLEITLLERLPLDRSVRFATAALTRYVIVALGILAVGNSLGIVWNNVQWLVAALTFGLGFGLQEIFANFVSGLIILFEQPVRVGDIVTVDTVTGTVNRIHIRATTIKDWDQKEYIVPNKELITGKLLNWTLTDTVNRIVVPVGVSYKSDPNQVREILTQLIQTQPHVLQEPPPVVVFDGFGDSALNFVVRAYLASFEHRLETIHTLNVRIHAAFAAARIEIPFPQRDLHLRSIIPVPLDSRALQAADDSPVPAPDTPEMPPGL